MTPVVINVGEMALSFCNQAGGATRSSELRQGASDREKNAGLSLLGRGARLKEMLKVRRGADLLSTEQFVRRFPTLASVPMVQEAVTTGRTGFFIPKQVLPSGKEFKPTMVVPSAATRSRAAADGARNHELTHLYQLNLPWHASTPGELLQRILPGNLLREFGASMAQVRGTTAAPFRAGLRAFLTRAKGWQDSYGEQAFAPFARLANTHWAARLNGMRLPKPARQIPPVSNTSAAQVKIAGLLDQIKTQLPGFHPYEAAGGALLGAGAGGLYSWLTKKPEHEDDKWRTARNATMGALIGAGGANLASDRARRYLSNAPNVYGYNPANIAKTLRENGMKGVWEGAVLDQPFGKSTSPFFGNSISMRRELLRRGMGVHSEGQPDNFFTPNADKTLSLHPRLFNEKNEVTDPMLWKSLYGGHTYQGGEDTMSSQVLGGYTKTTNGDQVRVRDKWDFGLNDNEGKALRELLNHRLFGGPKVDVMKHPHISADTPRSDQMLQSLLARHMADKVLMHKAPVFDQTFRLSPDEIGSRL